MGRVAQGVAAQAVVRPHSRRVHAASIPKRLASSLAPQKVQLPPNPMYQPPALPLAMSIAFSSAAPMIAVLFSNPFGMARTQLQQQGRPGSPVRFTGVADVLRKNWQYDGIRGLQRGLTSVLMREGWENSFRIGAYRPVLQLMGEDPASKVPVSSRVIASAICGAAGGFVANPFELIRSRFHVQTHPFIAVSPSYNYRNLRHAASVIFRSEGPTGFFTGAHVSVLRNMVINVVNLPSYTLLREEMLEQRLMKDGAGLDVFCSLISSFLTTLVVNPVDMLRTRLYSQLKGPDGRGMEYSSLLDATKKVARKEGVAAFWKGFWPLFLRNGPHMVITFAVLEQMQRLASKARTAEANRNFLTAVFHSLDADGNGVVDFSEFVSVFAHIGSLRPEGSGASEEALRAEAAALFREVDADGSGAIDVQEFVAAGKKMQQIIRLQELRAVFDAMDRDGSGAIDKEELFEAMKKQASADPKTMRELLQRYGDMDHVEQVWRRDVDSVFAKFDEDQNGTINFSGRAKVLEERRMLRRLVRISGVGAS